jgi:hypothetical protein
MILCDRCDLKKDTVVLPVGVEEKLENVCGSCISTMLGEANDLMKQLLAACKDKDAIIAALRAKPAKTA